MIMEHKVALVTGSSRGLGRAIAEALLKRQVKVCLADVKEEEGLKTLAELGAEYGKEQVEFTVCDVSQPQQIKDSWEKCTETLGAPDLLVNNAGIGDEKNWQKTLQINLGGVISGTLLAMEKMSTANEGKGGRVVNISSIAGVKNIPLGPIYSATKSGIVGFSRSLGHPLHFSLTGVKVQCACPSMIQTCFFSDAMKNPFSPAILKAASKTAGNLEFIPVDEVAESIISLIETGPNGGVMVIEPKKEPYYVDAAVPS